jgi:hypothetical protein
MDKSAIIPFSARDPTRGLIEPKRIRAISIFSRKMQSRVHRLCLGHHHLIS